jgi:sugar lactone lactonase YvrE
LLIRNQLVVTLSGGEVSEYVKEYEGKAFAVRCVISADFCSNMRQGPNSLIFDTKGNLFFTDSGPLGTTSLQTPKGSLFMVRIDGELLQPILYETLAHPTGLAMSPDESVLCVGGGWQSW